MSVIGSHVDRRARVRARLAVGFLAVLGVGSVVGGNIVAAQTDEEPEGPIPTVLSTTTTAPQETTTTAAEETTTTFESTTTTADELDELDDFDDPDDGEVDDSTSSTDVGETTTTVRNLLVPGDGTEGAQLTTTTSTTVVEVEDDEGGVSESTVIWMIVAGLVVIALLIGVWTFRYWQSTKPDPTAASPPAAPEDPTTVFQKQ